jgi:hypothetical protein
MNITEKLNNSEMDIVVFHDARDYKLKHFISNLFHNGR